MAQHIFTYTVKQSVFDGIRSVAIKDFGRNRDAAFRWLKENRERFEKRNDIFLEEREYTSEANLEKDFTLYTRIKWSTFFHGYELLPIIKG